MVAAFPVESTAGHHRGLGTASVQFAVAVLAMAAVAMIGAFAISVPGASGAPSTPGTSGDATTAHPASAPVVEPVPVARVAVVGDSLIATTTSDQHAELSRRGYDVTVEGNPGRPLTDPWIQARLHEAGDADIVVIATASNDNLRLAQRADDVGSASAIDDYAQTLTSTIDQVGAPCTVVVDVRERTSPLYRPETATTTNATLRSVTAANSHPTVVVAWSTESAAHDHGDWFVGDELHFIDDGQRQDAGIRAYTQAIADGVDRCNALLST
jgi:hypothetical protein